MTEQTIEARIEESKKLLQEAEEALVYDWYPGTRYQAKLLVELREADLAIDYITLEEAKEDNQA